MNYDHVLFWTGLDYKQQSYFRSIGIDMMSKDEDIKNIKIDLNKIDLDIFPNLEIFKYFPNAKMSGEIVGNYISQCVGTDTIENEIFVNNEKKKYEKTVIWKDDEDFKNVKIDFNKIDTVTFPNTQKYKTDIDVNVDAVSLICDIVDSELKKCSENSNDLKIDDQSLHGGSEIEHPSSVTLSMCNTKANNINTTEKNIDPHKVYKTHRKIDRVTGETITEFFDMSNFADANTVINAYKHLDFVDTNSSRTIVRDVPNNLYSFGRINNAYISVYSSSHDVTHYICKTKREFNIAAFKAVTYQGENFCVYYFNSEKDCQIFISEINNETFDLLETFESYSQKNTNVKQDAQKDIDSLCRHSFKQLIQEYNTCKQFIDYRTFGKILKIGIVEKTNILWEFSYYYGFATNNYNKILILRTCHELGIKVKMLVDSNGDQQLLIYGSLESLLDLHRKTNCFKVLQD